jgi:hypothetical protein
VGTAVSRGERIIRNKSLWLKLHGCYSHRGLQLYFHITRHQVLTHTWWCENITASPCVVVIFSRWVFPKIVQFSFKLSDSRCGYVRHNFFRLKFYPVERINLILYIYFLNLHAINVLLYRMKPRKHIYM